MINNYNYVHEQSYFPYVVPDPSIFQSCMQASLMWINVKAARSTNDYLYRNHNLASNSSYMYIYNFIDHSCAIELDDILLGFQATELFTASRYVLWCETKCHAQICAHLLHGWFQLIIITILINKTIWSWWLAAKIRLKMCWHHDLNWIWPLLFWINSGPSTVSHTAIDNALIQNYGWRCRAHASDTHQLYHYVHHPKSPGVI